MRTLFIAAALAFACLCSVQGDVGNLHPDAVLGKSDYTAPVGDTNPRVVQDIRGIAFDKVHGRIYATDTGTRRVLWWNNYNSLVTGQAADGALGQRDMCHTNADQDGISAATLTSPYGVAVDTSGNVWVADQGNNRVLRYDWPVTSGMNASIVLGQADFTGSGLPATSSSTLNCPRGLALDDAGNLWVADTSNNRVLEFAGPVFTNGQGAVKVLGQTDFVTRIARGTTATSLREPAGLAFDAAGNLWVADQGSQRVVRFPWTGSTIDTTIATVIGGIDKTTNNYGYGVRADSMKTPESVAIDRATGDIYVSDFDWHRILRFSNVTGDGASAVSVIGQADFTTSMFNDRNGDGVTEGPGPMTLAAASALAIDEEGHLWAGDIANARLLHYSTPTVTFPSADLVLGQASPWSAAGAAPDARLLSATMQMACDGDRLYVADPDNNRVLWWERAAARSNGEPADGVLGQESFTLREASATSRGMRYPTGVAVDGAGNLFVADYENSRVLVYFHPVTNMKAADRVLGQANFTYTAKNDTNGDGAREASPSAASLSHPISVAVDAGGHLWVMDLDNNRVLRYSPPFDNYKDADLVLGRPDFTSTASESTVTAHTLSSPYCVTCDRAGNVWIADSFNCRVLRFAPPFSNGMDASIVLGQPDFVTGSNLFTSPARRAPGAASVVRRSPFPPSTAAALILPFGVAIDQTGDVWVADTYNNRVVRYAVPVSSGMKACYVLGQQNFANNTANDWDNDGTSGYPDERTFSAPAGVCFDAAGNLWVADSGNNRVLRYDRHYVAPVVAGSSTTARMQMGNFTVDVNVPRDAFSGNASISVAPVIVPPSVSSQLTVTPISFEITDALGGQQPLLAITITIAYRAEDYTDAQARNLHLALYNSGSQTWTLVPTTVDTTQHLLTATISHFSTYAVVMTRALAPSGTVHAYPYPNPFRAGSETMKIEGQPDGTKINVFTVTGEHIRTLPSPDGNGTVTWDGKNDGGRTVASGVYLLSIDGPAGKKRVKVAVQK